MVYTKNNQKYVRRIHLVDTWLNLCFHTWSNTQGKCHFDVSLEIFLLYIEVLLFNIYLEPRHTLVLHLYPVSPCF